MQVLAVGSSIIKNTVRWAIEEGERGRGKGEREKNYYQCPLGRCPLGRCPMLYFLPHG
ncbi:MAG: hypothetical protein KME31_18150 [Tolypothrix carrinoi HA7290-LM1]|nr:hypothetical protein [Tolypothrix carrinoi HA7290-LM1]